MADTKEQVKVLFVGKERICRQIAYVLDIKDYEYTEKLTAGNCNQYHDHQIYVCEFKKKSGKYVDRKISKTVTNIQYMDDICRTIDEAYYANRKCHQNQSARQPLGKRIWDMLAWPFRAVRKALVWRKTTAQKNFRGDLVYLRDLAPSQLLLYVLRAPVKKNIQCTSLETKLYVYKKGNVRGCPSAMVQFGNLLRDGELNEIYNSTYARIVKLSSLNRSYCLCNFNRWCKGYCSAGKVLPTEQWETCAAPEKIALSFDPSCNLCCKSCHNEPYVMDDAARQETETITAKLLNSGYLEQARKLTVAGRGETFYSPFYRRLITTDLQRQQINIKSNGTLFNQANWQLLAGKYKTITVNISVDAATAETYQKLRGADFNYLMKNLTMLRDLRRQGQICKFNLNFVVQRDNFREMADFVRMGRSLGVDTIQFQRMYNFGNLTTGELLERCLIINNEYLDYGLWCVLQDPIFNDPIVDLEGLRRYIDASERKYRKRYEREQRKCSA